MLGAFKATPIRQLETEAYVPPLDLWLNGIVARLQARLERTGLAAKSETPAQLLKQNSEPEPREDANASSRQQTPQQPYGSSGWNNG